jgi:hypothetical protein|tara:strand:+ start:15796 stop:16803 length:1008 start_codon:yes stop_codon:yes gene_type:complete
MWDKKGEDIVFKWLYSLKEQVEETPAEAEPKPQEFTGQRISTEKLAQMDVAKVAKYAISRAEKCNNMGNVSVGNSDKKLVQQIQTKLKDAGANVADAEGVFGASTLIATIQIQKQKGIRTDGCIGQETAAAIGAGLGAKDVEAAKINVGDPNQPSVSRIGDKSEQPSNVVRVPSAWGKGALLDPVLAALVSRIQKDAAADGVPGVYPKGKILMVSGPGSGLRSLESQEANWKRALKKYGSAAKARIWVAMPISQGGEGSPHTTGRAIDFFLGMPPSSKNNEALKGTAAYRWLVANAHKYGLAQYKNEAWHWELNKPNREYFANLMSKPEEEIRTA